MTTLRVAFKLYYPHIELNNCALNILVTEKIKTTKLKPSKLVHRTVLPDNPGRMTFKLALLIE